MNSLIGAVVLVADDGDDIDPATGHGPEWGKASPVGLLVILLMAIALFFLLRSMVKHIKKVQAMSDSSPQEAVAPSAAVEAAPASTNSVVDEPVGPVSADPGSGPPGLVGGRSG